MSDTTIPAKFPCKDNILKMFNVHCMNEKSAREHKRSNGVEPKYDKKYATNKIIYLFLLLWFLILFS